MGSAGEASAEPPKIISPLQADGYLWAAPPSPTPTSQLRFQFGFNYHDFDYDFFGSSEELTFSSIHFLLSAEYTFLGALTAGLDVPALMIYDMTTSNDLFDDAGVDFGNIRLHLRYALILNQIGLVITPAFRIWLPTNTFLEVDFEALGRRQNLELIDTFSTLEPMVTVGWATPWLSLLLSTGPKFVIIDNSDDFSMWGLDLTVGAAPVASQPDLQFVLELNMLIEMDDDMYHTGDPDDTGLPLALGLGVRYRFGEFLTELALRAGLHDSEFYYGDFQLGLTVGWVFGG